MFCFGILLCLCFQLEIFTLFERLNLCEKTLQNRTLCILSYYIYIYNCNIIPPRITNMTMENQSFEPCFFCCSQVIYFVLPTRCLRLAYAVAVFSYARTICLDLPTRAYAYQLFSDFAYAACVCCFCGLSVGLNSSHFAWAPVLSVEVVFFVLLGATSHITTTKHNLQYHNKTLPPTPPAQKNINHHPQNAYEKPTRASEMPTPALHKTYFV